MRVAYGSAPKFCKLSAFISIRRPSHAPGASRAAAFRGISASAARGARRRRQRPRPERKRGRGPKPPTFTYFHLLSTRVAPTSHLHRTDIGPTSHRRGADIAVTSGLGEAQRRHFRPPRAARMHITSHRPGAAAAGRRKSPKHVFLFCSRFKAPDIHAAGWPRDAPRRAVEIRLDCTPGVRHEKSGTGCD